MLRPLHTLPLPALAISSLQAKGYHYVKDAITPTGISHEARNLLRPYGELCKEEYWEELSKAPAIRTALDVWQEENFTGCIATFSKGIDDLLGGGVPSFAVTEFCGPPGSGKTQMCLQLSINVQLPRKAGGLAGETIFVDTCSSFFLSRACDIAESCESHCLGLKEKYPELSGELTKIITENLLDGIRIISVHGYLKLLAAITSLRTFLEHHPNKVRLIVVDSLSFPFLGTSNTDYLERMCLLYRILSELQKLAHQFKLAVVVTNQLTTRITPGDNDKAADLVPALGETFAHRVNQRILFADVANSRTATLIKGRIWPDSSTVPFVINERGIRDCSP